MKFVVMSVEQAFESLKGKGYVLVAVQDLEKDEIAEFVKKKTSECGGIIEEAAIIYRGKDEFCEEMMLFSEDQNDIMNIEPHGILTTMLFDSDK